MLLKSEQDTLAHAGLNPQSISTLGAVSGARASIIAKPGGDNSTAAGSATGGNNSLTYGLVYANTTVPGGNTVANNAGVNILASKFTIPANFLQVGDVIFLRAWGVYGTAAVAPTLNILAGFGATVLITTGAIAKVINLVNDGWCVEGQFHIVASNSAECQGVAMFNNAAAGAAGYQLEPMRNAAAIAINTAIANTLQIAVQWGAAAAANTITLRSLSMRIEHAQNFG